MNVQSVLDRLKKPAEKILSEGNRSLEFVNRVQRKIAQVKIPKFTAIKQDLITGMEMLKSYIKGQYREIPWQSIVLFVGSLIYFLNPLDFIPDFIPLKGLIDDVTVLSFVLGSLKGDLEKFQKWKEQKSSQKDKSSNP